MSSSNNWAAAYTPTGIYTATGTGTVYADSSLPEEITIKDEYGNDRVLGVAEVSRVYAESLEYQEILRFARIFPEVKSILKELRVMMRLKDPYDEEELLQLESDSKNNK